MRFRFGAVFAAGRARARDAAAERLGAGWRAVLAALCHRRIFLDADFSSGQRTGSRIRFRVARRGSVASTVRSIEPY